MPDPAIQSRAYSAAHFALELDINNERSKEVGLFRSIEGGGVKVDVMNYQMGGNYERWRQLGKQKYEDIKLQVGMSMSKPFYEWIKMFFAGKADRRNGAIVACDFHYKERARREFTEAMIKEITFPKLDAQDKNAAYMNIGIAVEDIKFQPGNGQKLDAPKGMEGQKLWTSCNFRFELDGFADACRRVTKVDAFTIKQNVVEYHSGGRTAPSKSPSSIEYPQLSFYLPEADAQPLMDHFNKRALQEKREQVQKSSQTTEPKQTGQIVTYDNAMRPLFTVEFYEAEIIAITPDKGDAGSEEIKQVKVDILTEWMTFSYTRADGM